jgi:hypothetical protein
MVRMDGSAMGFLKVIHGRVDSGALDEGFW